MNLERTLEFETETEKLKFDIFGAAEVRKLGENLQIRENGNYLFYSGQSRGYRSTGFYIHKRWVERVTEIKGILERISLLKLEFGKKVKMLIIQVYVPTLQACIEEVEEFYSLLQKT